MYLIIGKYHGKSEIIDEFETREEADKMVLEYQIAYGNEWSFRIVERQVS